MVNEQHLTVEGTFDDVYLDCTLRLLILLNRLKRGERREKERAGEGKE